MRIATDVMGTLEGPMKKQILAMLEVFAKAGAEITVWSNLYDYAIDAVRDNNLRAEADSKKTKGDLDFDESQYFDLAFEDDRTQTYLPTKRFLFVDEIPDSVEEAEALANKLLGEL